MQHTTKYKFNLIETSDTFSPDALNANAQAMETQLAALADADAAVRSEFAVADAALKATDAANKAELLTAIGSGGKTCRIAYGTYKGTGKSVTVDFKPLVLFFGYNVSAAFLAIRGGGVVANYSTGITVTWGDNTLTWTDSNGGQTGSSPNSYVVIGESLS